MIEEPFAPVVPFGWYVPRPATEAALDEVVSLARQGVPTTALVGPDGIGKSLLLDVARQRLEDAGLGCVLLPSAPLPPDRLCAELLQALDAPPLDDPGTVFRAYLEHLLETGEGLVVLVDQAEAMPLATARWLGEQATYSDEAFRVVVAANDDADRVLSALGSRTRTVSITEPMTESETHRYVSARLTLADVTDEVLELFDAESVRELHDVSGGNPARVNTTAAAMARGASPTVFAAVTADEEPESAAPQPEADAEERGRDMERLRDVARRPPEPRVEPPPPSGQVLLTALAVAVAALLVGWMKGLASEPVPALPDPAPPPPIETSALPPVEAAPALEVALEDPIEPVAPLDPIEPVDPPELFQVSVNAIPWATIEVDGITLGETPIAGIPLLGGEHVIRATMADGRILERTVEIDEENRFIAFK